MTIDTTKLLLSLVRTELEEATGKEKLDLVQALKELSEGLEKFNPIDFARKFNLIILENFDYFYSDEVKDYKEEIDYLKSLGNILEIELAEIDTELEESLIDVKSEICLSVTDLDNNTYLFSKTNFVI